MPRAHIEKAKGNLKENYDYCSKDNNYVTNIKLKKDEEQIKSEILNDEYKDVSWKPWQQKALEILKNQPDKRKIHWFYEMNGNTGKSYLAKYICLTNEDVIIADGKKDNIFNQINKLIENGIEPRVIILDLPRHAKDYVNYGAIEQIKNGCIYSGKYEGGQCLFKIPHIIIFSNDEPDYTMWSYDRYDVVNI